MKYWFFDGNDVVGPFTLKELTQHKSFSETSLVCPENFSDDGDHWQVAATFDELKPLFAQKADEEDTITLEQEMDTLLKERSPLAFDKTSTDRSELQFPKKPAKPGPIEDYFNRIKEEDLGDILGIPNPNEDSDMDLAHALEKQLAKTSSTRREKQETTADEQTAAELTQAAATHHVATATEVFATQPSIAKSPAEKTTEQASQTSSMPTVAPLTLPVLEQDPVAVTTQETTPSSQAQAPLPTEPIKPAETDPAACIVPADKEGSVPSQQPVEIIADPALKRAEKVEVNSIRTHLKQTQEMKEIVNETQNAHLKKNSDTQRRMIVMLLAVLVIMAGVGLALQIHTDKQSPQFAVNTPKTSVAELLEETPAAPSSTAEPAAVSPEQEAISIVQNYPLSNKRGTIVNYLKRVYKTQLSQGYTDSWSAEPLYKNTYVVKYRLTKTRKEPIIYVFQADVAQGKLTSALNNISLDLVGKLST